MQFTILRAANESEAKLWDVAISMLPIARRDVHFTSAYGRVQERGGGEALLTLLTTEWGIMAQPFIKRAVPGDAALFDLCSPYGYGGPVASMEDQKEIDAAALRFRVALGSWCERERIVSEFCYLHPLMLEHQRKMLALMTPQTHIVKDVVVIDLAKLSEETVSRRVRRGIRRARKNEAKAQQMNVTLLTQSAFADLYEKSMDRKHAAKRWHWNRDYLKAHWSELSARLYSATGDGGIRMLMVIGGYGTAYAHLLASNGLAMHSGLDEMLYSHAAWSLRESGYERFHLGGGLTSAPDDRLLAFKAGFSDTRYKLHSYARIFDQERYDALARRKIDDEIAKHGHPLASGFFPTYRRGVA